MNLGIVGLSNYVQKAYIQYLNHEPSIRLNAVYDLKPANQLTAILSECLPTFKPQLFTDWQEFLAFKEIDAVLISTPHVFHFEQTRDCLRAGRHVFVDKPLACSYEDAQKLVDMAKDMNLLLAIGNQRRYEASYQKLKEIVTAGEVGEISLVHYLFANSPWYDYHKSWRGDPAINCGGAMIDIGHLAADMLLWLLDRKLNWVEAETLSTSEWPAEHTIVIFAQLEPQIVVNLTVSYLAPFPSVQEELSIYGKECNLFARRFATNRFSQSPPNLTQIYSNGESKEFVFTDKPQLWRPFEDFYNGIKTGKTVLSDGESNLKTIEFIENVYRSSRQKQRIYLRNNSSPAKHK